MAVFYPPRVSIEPGMVMIDAEAVRDALEEGPPTVRAAAFAGSAETFGEEEQRLCALGPVLQEGVAAVVSVRPVSEAVKVVEEGWVVGSLDRSTLVLITLPILIDRSVLSGVLSVVTAQVWVNPIQEIVDAGGVVRVVSFPT